MDNTKPTNILATDISDLFGFGEMSEEESDATAAEIGSVVLESALLRLATELEPEKQEALDQYLETNPAPEDILKHLSEHYEIFNQIVEEEVTAFKEEAIKILGTPTQTTPTKQQ